MCTRTHNPVKCIKWHTFNEIIDELQEVHLSVRFTLRQLEVFEAVARWGSFSKAAAELVNSPSAVSSAVKELERAVGATLCVRHTSQGVRLTPQGYLLQAEARKLLGEAEEIGNMLAETGDELQGMLRLGCYSSLASALLPGLLARFAKLHPRVQFELVEGSQTDLYTRMQRGEIDVSLVYSRFLEQDLAFTKVLSRIPYVLVAADHPLARRGRVNLAELEHDPLILLDLPPSRENVLAWCEEAGVAPYVKWVTKDIELTRSLVGRGLGYTLLLQRIHHRFATDGLEVCALEIEPQPRPVDIHLAWQSVGRSVPLRVRRFIEFATETLTRHESEL